MLADKFEEFLRLSAQLRPKYPQSLGKESTIWIETLKLFTSEIPEFYKVIYSSLEGTKRDIKDQRLMDFIPGYRLIHIEEFIREKRNIDNILDNEVQTNGNIVLPILTNYSSDFVCYYQGKNNVTGTICDLLHDSGELVEMHKSPEKFLETICEFYKQGVYFLDSDGYLDYNLEKEGEIGSLINPGLNYWFG